MRMIRLLRTVSALLQANVWGLKVVGATELIRGQTIDLYRMNSAGQHDRQHLGVGYTSPVDNTEVN